MFDFVFMFVYFLGLRFKNDIYVCRLVFLFFFLHLTIS